MGDCFRRRSRDPVFCRKRRQINYPASTISGCQNRRDTGNVIGWDTDESRFIFIGAEKMKREDRKSTRLNSSHVKISYAVFCLKKKKKKQEKDLNSRQYEV